MSDTVGVVAAILLGAAFVLAGASKLAAGSAWPAQAAGLGAPTWSVAPLPWIELGLGVLGVERADDRQPARERLHEVAGRRGIRVCLAHRLTLPITLCPHRAPMPYSGWFASKTSTRRASAALPRFSLSTA